MPGRLNHNYCYNPFAEGLDMDMLLPKEGGYWDKKDCCRKCMGECVLVFESNMKGRRDSGHIIQLLIRNVF